jgi:diguanylate cyclase (GGDEF)-like protein
MLAVVATGGLLFWERSRYDRRVRVAVSKGVADEAARRMSETQRLVTFGQAVARAMDHASMRSAVNQHLPNITGTTDAWVLTRQGPGWDLLAGPPASDRDAARRRTELADAVARGDRAGDTSDQRAAFPIVIGGTTTGVIGIEAAGRLDEERRRIIQTAASLVAVSLRNVQLFQDVRETGVRDGLTGCWTRGHTMQVLDGELRRARRETLPLSIILFDLDHFKAVNDRHGHLCGDAVLAEVGRRFHQVLRASDHKCRYGGEEFLGVLPATALHGAGCVAEELRREISGQPISWNNVRLTVTASLGVTQADPGELDIDAIIGRADAALYRAKQQGRDRVRFEPDSPTLPGGRALDAASAPGPDAGSEGDERD